MTEQGLCLSIVEIEKYKERRDKALFFEIDIIVQMMRAFTVDSIKGYAMEINSIPVKSSEREELPFSMTCMLPIFCPQEVISELKFIEETTDNHVKMDYSDLVMRKYAIMTKDINLFSSLWSGQNYATCRFIFNLKSGENMKIGPFKLIDLIRDYIVM